MSTCFLEYYRTSTAWCNWVDNSGQEKAHDLKLTAYRAYRRLLWTICVGSTVYFKASVFMLGGLAGSSPPHQPIPMDIPGILRAVGELLRG